MANTQALRIQMELVWWILTIILSLGILFPIWREAVDYPFYGMNILFIITFVTVSRYLFLLKHTFLGSRQIVKLVLMILLIPFIFHLVSEINHFQTFLDENGQESVVGNLPYDRIGPLTRYAHSELMLFGVGSVIACVLFFFRLIISVWRYRNKGTV